MQRLQKNISVLFLKFLNEIFKINKPLRQFLLSERFIVFFDEDFYYYHFSRII
jgi:hypothetical protein